MRVLIFILLLSGCSHFKKTEQSTKEKNPYPLKHWRGIPTEIEDSILKELEKQKNKLQNRLPIKVL